MQKMTLILAAAAGALTLAAAEPVLIFQDDFEFAQPGDALPAGHARFFGSKLKGDDAKNTPTKISVVAVKDGKEVIIDDNCPETGLGICKTFEAVPGATYRAVLTARPLEGRNPEGFFIQLNGGKVVKSAQIKTPAAGETYANTEVELTVPADADKLMYYAYTNYGSKAAVAIKEIKIFKVSEPAPPSAEEKKAGSLLYDDFADATVGKALPDKYKLFFSTKLKDEAAKNTDTRVEVIEGANGKELVIFDNCPQTGLGPCIDFPAKAGETYRATVKARPLDGKTLEGAVVQLTPLPSQKSKSAQLKTPAPGATYGETSVTHTVGEKDTVMRLYIYSNYEKSPGVAIKEIRLQKVE